MEYLKIPKKSNYNSEKRRVVVIDNEEKETKEDEKEDTDAMDEDDEYGFDIEKLTDEQRTVSGICGHDPVEYDSVIDEQIVNYYVSYLITHDFKQCLHDIELRYKSEWLSKWIEQVKYCVTLLYIPIIIVCIWCRIQTKTLRMH